MHPTTGLSRPHLAHRFYFSYSWCNYEKLFILLAIFLAIEQLKPVRATRIPQTPAKMPKFVLISLGKHDSGGSSMYSVQMILICE